MVQAYSIGTGKRGQLTKNDNPGPGAYSYDKKQKKQPPNWKIGTQNRSGWDKKDTPGPGSYQLRTKGDGPLYTLRPKTAVKGDTMNVPGSGTYDPKIYSQFKSSVGWSMGMKPSMSDSKLRVPGPGTYEYKSTVDNRPSYVFGRDSNRNFYQTPKTPGPGTYKSGHRPDSASGPRWGFGTNERNGFNVSSNNPGPGSYENKSALDQYYSKTTNGATMISRRNMDGHEKTPGAGTYHNIGFYKLIVTYDPTFHNKKSMPKYKIGTSTRDQWGGKGSREVPGAGSYNPNFYDRPKSPEIRVGSDVRKPLTQTGRTPGPGTYELPHRGIEGPQFSFKGVQSIDPVQREKMKVPGSGTYDPSVDYVKERPQSAKIGTGIRQQKGEFKNPVGPGYYEMRGIPGKDQSKWGFGSEIQRPSSSKVYSPGPGTYNLKPNFADVPKYLIPNPQSSKYL